MRYNWLDEYLLSKPGVTKNLQTDWNWIRYLIGGKMFVAVCLGAEEKPYYITLKLEPAEGAFLREQYSDIIPGYYCNKEHWNSVRPDGEVPDDVLRTMLDHAYRAVLTSLSRNAQREALGMSCCGTVCASCTYRGTVCRGCNESRGCVFHMPEGIPCQIYACCVKKHRYATCGECEALPCDIWRETRDPSFSDEAFKENIAQRVSALEKLRLAMSVKV